MFVNRLYRMRFKKSSFRIFRREIQIWFVEARDMHRQRLFKSSILRYERFTSILKHIWLRYVVIWNFRSKSPQNKSPGFRFVGEIFGWESFYIHISSLNKPYLHLLSRKMQKPGLFDTLGIWAICKHFQAYLAWLCVHMGYSLKLAPQ